jgi:hypothetical protein
MSEVFEALLDEDKVKELLENGKEWQREELVFALVCLPFLVSDNDVKTLNVLSEEHKAQAWHQLLSLLL